MPRKDLINAYLLKQLQLQKQYALNGAAFAREMAKEDLEMSGTEKLFIKAEEGIMDNMKESFRLLEVISREADGG